MEKDRKSINKSTMIISLINQSGKSWEKVNNDRFKYDEDRLWL